jgi:hypothetical protein
MNEHSVIDACTRFEPGEPAAALLVDVLRDASTWLEASAALEDVVVGAVGAARTRQRAMRRLWLRAAAVTTAIAAAFALVLGVLSGHESHADFTGRLTASGSVRAAAGSAEVYRSSSGFRVALDATGLPDQPAGRYYEAWLADTNGTELPVGTFSSSRGEITLWAGLSSADFSRMTVTLETVDNDQAPSSDVVLAGALHRA